MATIRAAAASFVLAGLVAGCSGGGSSDSGPPPPPPGQALSITLAAAGSLPADIIPSRALSGFQLLSSQDEYIQFASGLGPFELRTLDYTQFSVMYVEGPADDFMGAVARLVEIRRIDGTRDTVTGERCRLDPVAIPTPSRAIRPYAFYVVPKLMATTTYQWTESVSPACSTVTPVAATFVGASEWGSFFGRPQPPVDRAIRTQADLDAVLPSFAPGTIPPQYLAPDFSQITLLFVNHGVLSPTQGAYVRIDRVLVNKDSSRDVIAEFCGDFSAHTIFNGAMALYAVPRFTEDVRFTHIRHVPGACFLPR